MKYKVYVAVLLAMWIPVLVLELYSLLIIVFGITIVYSAYMYAQRLEDDDRELR